MGYLSNGWENEKMKKILWISRHEMTIEQLDDLKRIYGEISITKVDKTIADVKEIEKYKDYDVIAVVLPINIIAELVSKKLNVCLIGVKPTFPSIQFGYILHKKDIVDKFFEKSDKKSAKKLINENALWNSGIVIFKLRHIVDLSQNYFKYKYSFKSA